jgi:hypothetical protein
LAFCKEFLGECVQEGLLDVLACKAHLAVIRGREVTSDLEEDLERNRHQRGHVEVVSIQGVYEVIGDTVGIVVTVVFEWRRKESKCVSEMRD